jgi:hypothetical protein
VHDWCVKFPHLALNLAHEGTADTFAFATARPPEHVVTVQAVDKSTQIPLKDAFVTLLSSGAPYRNRTDDAGVASLSVPKGEYRLYVSKNNYLDFQTVADVRSNVAVKAELVFAPDDFG